MKRILLMGTAVSALFTAGISTATAVAASPTKTVKKTVTKTVPVSATCKLALTTLAPAGSTAPVAGGQQGVNAGATSCNAPLSRGFSRQSYTLDTAGDLNGKIQSWFGSGSVFGTYTLTPSSASGPPTTSSFGSAAYTGTVKITGASGTLKGATGTGTLTCSTSDSVHYNCTEKLKLTQKVKTIEIVKAPSKKHSTKH